MEDNQNIAVSNHNDENENDNGKNLPVDKKKFLKNIVFVIISNALTVLAGILTGFFIPKMMGKFDYGYYKTFTLYVGYVGLFHFGFVDGIYLYFAGRKYDSLSKEKFRFYTRFLVMLEAIITLIGVIIFMMLYKHDFSIIVLMVSLNLFAINMTTYYEFISQTTMRFKQLSIRSIIKTILTVISVVTLFLLNKYMDYTITYYIYTIIVVTINYILMIWYMISYRELTFGKANKFKDEKDNIKLFFKRGIPLLITNLVFQLIFIIDQQFVNIFFDTETYATYAFAYSMMNLITVATNAISTVLYPTIRVMTEESVTKSYSKINSYLLVFVALCLAAYHPLVFVVNNFLTQYNESLIILRIILPGVLVSSSISVIKYNCYKKFDLINKYFIKSLFILCLAIVANTVVYFVFKNTITISMVSIGVCLMWYIITEYYFIKKYKVQWLKNFVFMLFIIGFFYGATYVSNVYISLAIYLVGAFLLILIFYFKEIKELIKKKV